MSEVTEEGKRLINAWTAAQDRIANLRRQMTDAQNAERTATALLANWLKPHDAKPGEKFSVWFGDNLIQVEVGGVVQAGDDDMPASKTHDRVTVRTRGKRGL